MSMAIPFVGPAYKSRSLPISAQTCINWYVEQSPEGGEGVASLQPTPGLLLFADLGTEKPVVGMRVMGNYLYAISDGKLFRVSTSGTVTTIGDVLTEAERVPMVHNGTQLMGADETGGMIYTAAGGLQTIADADFPGAASLAYFDGYFVYVFPNSNKFGVSALNDGFTYDALQYASAEGDPDKLVACVNDHRQLWLFGEKTTEIWYNSGSSYFPFSRYGGAFIERGCAARYSPAKADNTVFWLGDDLVIYRAVNFIPGRISTHALETEIRFYNTAKDAFAYTYSHLGHTFYVITFPSAEILADGEKRGRTWAYDTVTDMWHQRQSYDDTRHRGNCYENFFSMHMIGDYRNGRIYRYHSGTFTEDGDPLIRERTTQVLRADGDLIRIGALQVKFDHGVGTDSGQGASPQAMLQWSDDGGNTWSNEMWAGIGKMGEYGYRSIWRRLGSFRQRIFRLRVSDPVKAVVIGASADIERLLP